MAVVTRSFRSVPRKIRCSATWDQRTSSTNSYWQVTPSPRMKLSELPMNGFAPGGPLRIGRSVQNSFELGAGRFVEVAAEPKSLIVEEGNMNQLRRSGRPTGVPFAPRQLFC